MKKSFTLIFICICLVIAGGWFLYQGRLLLHPVHQTPATPVPPHTDTPAEITAKQLACVANMPLSQRIGQKIMLAAYAQSLADETPMLANASIGGIIIMNEIPGDQITAFRKVMQIAPLIAVDQEGGTVQRYTAEGTLPGAAEMAANGSTDAAYQQYLADNQYLKTIGITTNFAPLVDVISRQPLPLPDRMYSSNPAVVSQYAVASSKAAQAAGITPVIKHFPGLGSATGNTDFTAATTDPLATLQTRDLIPYQKLAPLHPDVMVGNMIVPGLTDGQPAVWSKPAIDLLRSLGYQNAVVYTDSLTANAIPGTLDEAVLKTWQAGTDVALIVQDSSDTSGLASYLSMITTRITSALQSGELKSTDLNASVLRILERKQIDPCKLNATAP